MLSKDEIIRMAREAGWQYADGDDGYKPLWRFAALVAAHEREKLHNEIATLQCDIEEMYSRADVDYLIGVEREACAKVCEARYNSPDFNDEAIECADAIRARGLTKSNTGE